MPGKITIDDALGEASKSKQKAITIDDAMADYESGMRPTRIVGYGGNAQRDASGNYFPDVLPVGSDMPPGFAMRPTDRPLQPSDSNMMASLKAKLVEDPQTKRRLVAESLFPGDESAINRVGFIDDRAVFVNDDGKLEYVSGKAGDLVSSALANAPEVTGSVAGSFAASPVIGSTLGAMGAKGMKRAAAGLMFDEPQTISGNLKDVAGEGAINLVAGGAGKVASKFADRGKIIDFNPANIQKAEQAREYIKRTTGIDTDIAQASGDRKLIALRDYAARFPGKSADLIQAADDAAAGQFEQATTRVLDLVAKAEPSEIAGLRGINAAQLAIKVAREKVYREVDPLYAAAYKAVPEITDTQTLRYLDLPYFKEAHKQGKKLAELEGFDTKVTDLRSLDYTKRALDDQIEVLSESGKKQAARALKMKRDEFVSRIDSIPNQQWQLARKRYAELIKSDVEPLEQGAVGVLANIKNPRAATAAAKILNDANITPGQVSRARVIVEQQDPEAWKGLVRQWIGQKYNLAFKETQAGDVVNPAGKLRQALYGTPADKAKTMAMLDTPSAHALDDLMVAAEALAKTPLGASRVAGSNTARDLETTETLKGTGAVMFRWLTSPRESIRTAAEQRAKEQNILAITEAILDPAKRRQLRQVARMSPSTKQAIILTSILTGQSSKAAFPNGPDVLPGQ